MSRRGVIRMVSPATFEEHVEAWKDAGRDIEQGMWKRAAVAASFLESHQADKAAARAFAEKVDCKIAYFYRLAQVHRAFADRSTRVDHLSFTHHFEASGEDDPKAALQHAADEALSARAFHAYLHPAKALVEHKREQAAALADAAEARQASPLSAVEPRQQESTAAPGPGTNVSLLAALGAAGEAAYEEWDEADSYALLIAWARDFLTHVEQLERARAKRSEA